MLTERFKAIWVLWGIALWLLRSLGFSVLTPHMNANQLKAFFDSTLVHQQKEIDSNRLSIQINANTQADMASQMKILLKYDCVNQSVSSHDKALIGLDCSQILSAPTSPLKGTHP